MSCGRCSFLSSRHLRGNLPHRRSKVELKWTWFMVATILALRFDVCTAAAIRAIRTFFQAARFAACIVSVFCRSHRGRTTHGPSKSVAGKPSHSSESSMGNYTPLSSMTNMTGYNRRCKYHSTNIRAPRDSKHGKHLQGHLYSWRGNKNRPAR